MRIDDRQEKSRNEVMDMEPLKKAYDNIPIPEELKEKVLDALKEGKAESNMKPNEKRGKLSNILLRSGQTAAAALLAITVLANSGASVAYAMEQIPVIGAITKVVTFRTYEKKEGNTEAKVEIPKVEAEQGSGYGDAVNQVNLSVEEYTNQIISQFEADVKAGGGELHKGLYSDYEVLTDNDRLFTLRINTEEVMASAAVSVKIYTIDKKSGKILALKDMFPQGTDYVTMLSNAIKTQMEADMNGDSGKSYFLNDGMDSDFTAIKENQNFYINADGHLVLVFDEYEIAPGYMGVVEMEVPETILKY